MSVPCNGCTLCCQNDLLILHPELGDDATQYETVQVKNPVTGKPAIALKHKPEGGCIYLNENGCSIHGRAPAICQEFDCRQFYKNILEKYSRKERRQLVKSGLVGRDVIEAGRKRMPSLNPEAA